MASCLLRPPPQMCVKNRSFSTVHMQRSSSCIVQCNATQDQSALQGTRQRSQGQRMMDKLPNNFQLIPIATVRLRRFNCNGYGFQQKHWVGGLGVGSPLRTDRAFGPGNLNPAFRPCESCSGQNRPKTGPGSPVRGPAASLRNRKILMRLTFGRLWNYIFIGRGGFPPDPIQKTCPCPKSTPKGWKRGPRPIPNHCQIEQNSMH